MIIASEINTTWGIALAYADARRGIPYKYGGESFAGEDCSGHVRNVLSKVNRWPFDAHADANAHTLWTALKSLGAEVTEQELKPGCLVFRLKDGIAVHVEIVWWFTELSIGAAGGDKDTDTLPEAIAANAFVRIRDHARLGQSRRYVDPFWKDRPAKEVSGGSVA